MADHKEKSISFNRWRMLSLTVSFLVILVNPFINFYSGVNWVQGWYQSLGVGHLWFVSPLEGLESLLVTRILFLPSLIGMAIPVVLALLLGRVFCSWICPINFFGELLDRIKGVILRQKHLHDRLVLAKRLLWFALIGELLVTMILGAPVFVFISPPGLVGREIMMAVFFHKLALEGVVLIAVLFLELLTRRFYCRYFCPLGGLLALIGTRRRAVITRDRESCVQCDLCYRACPLGLKPSDDEAMSVYCWNCGACIDVCSTGALAFEWKCGKFMPFSSMNSKQGGRTMKTTGVHGNSRTGLTVAGALCGAVLMGMMSATPAGAATGSMDNKIADSLHGDWGLIKLNIRYRFEHVEQDGKDTTNGDPIRLRLGYLTPNKSGFQAFVEFEGNNSVFVEDYNNTANDKTGYAVIADPNKGELNQGWLAYSGVKDTVLKVGRQEMNYDNQRFVGAVAWRQMEQTFDTVTVLNKSIGNTALTAAYLWNVRTITSRDVNMASPLLNLSYTFTDIGKLTAYGYWLDYDDEKNYGLSSQTYGLRFNGITPVADKLNLVYTAEYAYQSDYQDNPVDYSADYYHFIGGLNVTDVCPVVNTITAKIAWESQGADNGTSFKTPIGTNHKFNGWADQFLTTPDTGLRDLYGSLAAMIYGVKAQVFYHQFDADEGGADYGDEWDFMLSKKFNKHYSILAAYADYSADEFKTDAQRIWLQLVAQF